MGCWLFGACVLPRLQARTRSNVQNKEGYNAQQCSTTTLTALEIRSTDPATATQEGLQQHYVESDTKLLQKVPVKYRQKDDHISSARIFESAQHVSLIFTAIAQLKDIKTP